MKNKTKKICIVSAALLSLSCIAAGCAAKSDANGTESGEKQLLHRAMELLRDCRLKVYEVAEQVGYRDIAYFSATFKKLVGMSPSEYQDVSN